MIPDPVRDPDAVGAAAISQYDTNGDGQIDPTEMASSPGLVEGLAYTDLDGDGNLTAEEIAKRIIFHDRRKVRVMNAQYEVTLDGEPLEGATLTMVPEDFFGGALPSAVGTTDANGFVEPTITFSRELEADGLSGAHPGVYRIEISKKDASGTELIPAKYNTQTELGRDLGIPRGQHNTLVKQTLKLELTSN